MMRQTTILQVLFIYQPHGKDLGRISKWYSTWTVHCWCEFWEENITTGNELEGESLTEFSKKLDVNSLYEYTKNVMFSINAMLFLLLQRLLLHTVPKRQPIPFRCIRLISAPLQLILQDFLRFQLPAAMIKTVCLSDFPS